MTDLVFLDTETTGLDAARHDVWEIAALHGRVESVFRPRPDLSTADPTSLRMTRFYERTGQGKVTSKWQWEAPGDVAHRLAPILAGRHVVAAVPSFDAAFLDRFLRAHGQAPAWHYHLIDVEGMAVGWLRGRYSRFDAGGNVAGPPVEAEGEVVELPWKSDELSRACGVEPPGPDRRHTALGDARWVKRWYEALTGTGTT